MSESKTAPAGNGLYAALAQLQAKMPTVAKNRTGKIPGKDGKQGYSYDYADLADVTAAVLPLMGSLGLAFTSRPTVNAAGQFVLAYKLAHVSGEADEGEYLLPSPERVSPQQLGSFITYARRYSLCCITGLAPGGDDDDAQSAQQVARDAWESATPAQPRGRQQAAPNGSEWESASPNGNGHHPPVVTDPKWLDEVKPLCMAFKTTEDGRALWRRVTEKTDAGGCSSHDADELKEFIRARQKELVDGDSKQPAAAGALS